MDLPAEIISSELKRIWGIDALSIEQVKDVYMVKAEEAIYCLKPYMKKENFMIFLSSIIRHLEGEGFTLMPRLYDTLDGRPFEEISGEYCFLTEWVKGGQANFRHPIQISEASKSLALFHRAALGYHPPPGIGIRQKAHKLPKLLREKTSELAEFRERVAETRYKRRFDLIFLENFDWLISLAERSIEALEGVDYARLAKDYAKEGGFCHGDVAERNFIWKDGAMYIIDFDVCRLDLRITDLYKLIRRTMKRCRWDFNVAQVIIKSYGSVYPVSNDEIRVLYSLLLFPQKYWRIISRFYKGGSGKYKLWSRAKFADKFSEYLRHRDAIDIFLKKFADHYITQRRTTFRIG